MKGLTVDWATLHGVRGGGSGEAGKIVRKAKKEKICPVHPDGWKMVKPDHDKAVARVACSLCTSVWIARNS